MGVIKEVRLFKANWCGHCQNLQNRGIIAEVQKKIPVTVIDCSSEVPDRYKDMVHSFPSLYHGKDLYPGSMNSANDIVNWVETQRNAIQGGDSFGLTDPDYIRSLKHRITEIEKVTGPNQSMRSLLSEIIELM